MHRRNFLKAASATASWGALAQLAGISPLRSMAALAQSTSSTDYKAIICLFMRGGNDSNNMIVPITGSQYTAYSTARGAAAIAQNQLLPLTNSAYGVNAAFTNVQQAFGAGHAAFIHNVGPLVQPTTVAQYQAASVPIPGQLMAHDDQQEVWELGGYTPGIGSSWSGLTADLLSSQYNSPNLPMVTLLGQASDFGRGVTSAPFTANANDQQVNFWCADGTYCGNRETAAQQLLTFNNGVNLLQADQQIYQNAYKYNNFYNNVLASAQPLQTQFPSNNPLSGALKTIATMMQLRNQIGAGRQIFFVDAGGYDTHSAQSSVQTALYSQIDEFVGTYVQVMQELGLYNNVVMFTASDFSRTLQINGNGGTDHAWGGHHFVVGGPVKGGQTFGTMPNLTLGGPDDLDGSGRFIPTIALSQYAATIASWFGVPSASLPGMFPGLSNFSSSNVGFI
jgi:uncharacterized protein (DUF1501 family)